MTVSWRDEHLALERDFYVEMCRLERWSVRTLALLSDGSIHSYLSQPQFDLDGIRLLATSLLLNGIAMEMCGSSRPASGSEHLISHALDALSARPRLHGLQVGIATYLVSILQGGNTDRSPACSM